MTENEQARYDELKQQILKCIDHSFKMPNNIPIPFERSVLYKILPQAEVTTDSGLILGGIEAANIRKPNIGIVVAVGPRVPNYIVPKLRAYFNQDNVLEFLVGGHFYKMCDFCEIFGAVNENTLTSIEPKGEREMVREKGIKQETNYNLAVKLRDDEEKNIKELEKKLGKNFKA